MKTALYFENTVISIRLFKGIGLSNEIIDALGSDGTATIHNDALLQILTRVNVPNSYMISYTGGWRFLKY